MPIPHPTKTPPAASSLKKDPLPSVIPDCCNIGVVFRTLFLVNGVILGAIILRTNGLRPALYDFVESSMLVEWVCLLSLLALCGIRNLLLQSGALHEISVWAQRAVCVLVPALITGFMLKMLMPFDWFRSSFTHLTLSEGMLVAGLFGLSLQHYLELRTRAFSPALVEARLQALQARIRPHFLFNSLNAVISLIRTEPLRAEASLEDLADLFRVLMRDARDMTSLEDEVHLCQQYLSIEKIRLGERLQVEWDMNNISESALRKAQVSALLLQPLLENAVHYGVEPAREAALIRIRIRMMRALDRIEIVVINPLHRDNVAVSGNQMALNNIRERLVLLYDVEAQLNVAVVNGHFEVRLRFPYVRASGNSTLSLSLHRSASKGASNASNKSVPKTISRTVRRAKP